MPEGDHEPSQRANVSSKFCGPGAAPAATEETMKALHIVKHLDLSSATDSEVATAFQMKEVPKPTPGKGEVLIKVFRSGVSPLDLDSIAGNGAVNPEVPFIPGGEGAGIVVGHQAGISGWRLVGHRVAFLTPSGTGAFAPFVAVPSNAVIPLPDTVAFDAGAYSMLAPLMALAVFDVTAQAKSPAVIVAAGASSVGKMILRLSKERRIQVIAIVHRPELVQTCLEAGALESNILVSSAPDFTERLKKVVQETKATIAFDAVGGETLGAIIESLPKGGVVYLHGNLSKRAANFSPRHLINGEKEIHGFVLESFLKTKWAVNVAATFRALSRGLTGALETTINHTVAAADSGAHIAKYARQMTNGKIAVGPILLAGTPPLGKGVFTADEEAEMKLKKSVVSPMPDEDPKESRKSGENPTDSGTAAGEVPSAPVRTDEIRTTVPARGQEGGRHRKGRTPGEGSPVSDHISTETAPVRAAIEA